MYYLIINFVDSFKQRQSATVDYSTHCNWFHHAGLSKHRHLTLFAHIPSSSSLFLCVIYKLTCSCLLFLPKTTKKSQLFFPLFRLLSSPNKTREMLNKRINSRNSIEHRKALHKNLIEWLIELNFYKTKN